ncbi:alpha/beta hydrolase-fold protein [Corynebacterium sp. L4756]|uniref:alpha/beta hydrolase-fold protein n=1 Tax=unclassified Corynebacterium TaxID=2624378 RepID=UPI00374D1CC3
MIEKLTAAAHAGELEHAWQDLVHQGTPLVDGTTATFLLRLSELDLDKAELAAVRGVHLFLNRITDKQHFNTGLMRQVPETDIWALEMELSPTYRGSYGFRLLTEKELAGDAATQRPPHNGFLTVADPHGTERLDNAGGLSVVSGVHAPESTAWTHRPVNIQGTVISGHLAGSDIDVMGYFPATDKPCAVLTLFDAEAWFDRISLPTALEAAMAAGMGPVAVLGVRNRDTPHRMQQLRANKDFLAAIATDGTAWLQKHAAHAGVILDKQRHIIAGQSLGGLSALIAGLQYPESYHAVIAQSPSLWFSPDVPGAPGAPHSTQRSTPRDLDKPSHGWLVEQVYQADRVPARIIIDVGAREGAMVNKAHLLDMALNTHKARHELNVYDGGHDYAWWRVALIEHLFALA